MFRKILVPVDLTDKHQPVVTLAAQLAQQGEGAVTLLHVIELLQGVSFEEEKDFYGRLEAAARAHLAKLGSLLEERHVPWQAEIRYGDRGEEIIRYALETATDLIVLSSHRIDLEHPGAGWGTLSYKIGFLSQCPVLLVK
jgi:nucleotide-binding universal stress UspA family protein